MFLFKPTDVVGPFMVIQTVKEGAYAETYLVKAPSGSIYFLKLLSYKKMGDEQFNENRDAVEVLVSKKLRNDNLLKFHGYGDFEQEGNKYVYIVYDYISGKTLPEWLSETNHFSVPTAVQITVNVLDALKYLYSLTPRILHNNITLDNIMISEGKDGIEAKLIDFGHAKFDTQYYSFFEHEGNDIFYLAPESFNGESSIQSDLYSVGVVLFALIFGRLPFYEDPVKYSGPSDGWKELVYNKKSGVLEIPSVIPEGVTKELIQVIRKALAFSPSERYPSAEAFHNALTDGLKGISPSTYVASFSAPAKGSGFDAIAGMQILKDRLQNDVIDVLKDAERAKALGIDIPNGLLLYGPPGCGKTFFAEKFAEELGCNYMYIKCSDVASPYIHGGQEKIAKIFEDARKNSPTVLFLDEIEAMLTDREVQRTVSEAGEVNEFLAQMNNCGKDGVLVIGASNHPQKIDKAALRAGRLELHYYIGNPDLECRMELFRINLRRRSVQGKVDLQRLAEKTEGYASVDIKAIVDNAGRYVFRQKRDAITMADLEYALGQTKPSLTNSQIKEFERIRDIFENKSTRTKIGF